jgi:hypothetical protein
MSGPISRFIDHHYRHFNAAALKDAADGYIRHLETGGHMFVTIAGAMSTAELGLSLAEMIRQDKIHAISCTGANLEEDLFNLVAHDHYERLPRYRELTRADEQKLLERHLNRSPTRRFPRKRRCAASSGSSANAGLPPTRRAGARCRMSSCTTCCSTAA